MLDSLERIKESVQDFEKDMPSLRQNLENIQNLLEKASDEICEALGCLGDGIDERATTPEAKSKKVPKAPRKAKTPRDTTASGKSRKIRERGAAGVCTWPGCDKKAGGRLCGMHYYRKQKGLEMDTPSARGKPKKKATSDAEVIETMNKRKMPAGTRAMFRGEAKDTIKKAHDKKVSKPKPTPDPYGFSEDPEAPY